MDARAARQAHFDANKIRTLIADYLGMMSNELQMKRTLETILTLIPSISLSC
jgi:hypothetical protein